LAVTGYPHTGVVASVAPKPLLVNPRGIGARYIPPTRSSPAVAGMTGMEDPGHHIKAFNYYNINTTTKQLQLQKLLKAFRLYHSL